jgi:hypothetical protein
MRSPYSYAAPRTVTPPADDIHDEPQRSPYYYAAVATPQASAPPPPASLWPNNEAIDDRIADLLVAGDNVSLDYDDDAGTLTISAEGGPETTISTLPPSGGVDGDVWYQVPA